MSSLGLRNWRGQIVEPLANFAAADVAPPPSGEGASIAHDGDASANSDKNGKKEKHKKKKRTRSHREGDDSGRGDDCDVPLKDKNAVGTTQEEICGKATATTNPPTGGTCKSASDCNNGGDCVEADKVKQCKCAASHTGSKCGFKDEATCPAAAAASDKPAATRTDALVSSVGMAAVAAVLVVVA